MKEETGISDPRQRVLGYARVSSVSESLDNQLTRLCAEGCTLIYRDHESAARFKRSQLQHLLEAVRAGDRVLVTRLDRLARSPVDLFAVLRRIIDVGASFQSLAEPWADTESKTGQLMLAVLGALADVDRDLLRTRLAEGKNRARAEGKRMGRHPALTREQQQEVVRRRSEGATLAELAVRYNVSITTISRLARQLPS